MTGLRRWLSKLALPALALAALGGGGCLAVAAGVGAGAGAVAYTYYNGLLYRDYHADLADSSSAVRAALDDLKLPVIDQTNGTGSVTLKSRTATGHTVRIYLAVVPSPIPAEGSLTRIQIRVGLAGDEQVSARILDQINHRLEAPAPIPAPPSGALLGNPQPMPREQPAALRRAVHETPAPPLALAPPPSPPVPLASVEAPVVPSAPAKPK
jgi:hypothetical protein